VTFNSLEDIDVWKRGCRLAVGVYDLTKKEPLNRDWGLKDQLRRSAVSIASNIAEGYERDSQKEFIRFLFIAKGSCGELRTQLYILKALEWIAQEDIDLLIQESKEISSMIQGLIKYLTKLLQS